MAKKKGIRSEVVKPEEVPEDVRRDIEATWAGDEDAPDPADDAREEHKRWEDRERERLRGALIPDEPHRLRERDGQVHPPKIKLRPHEAEILKDAQPHNEFTDERKQRFIELLMSYGVKHKCAKAVGICPYTFNLHMKKDPEFAEAVNLALEVFRDTLEEVIIDRAVHGWVEPLTSGGMVVGYVKKFDNRLLELLLKRHIPEFRDKQQIDMKVSGGVLVAPQRPVDADTWRAQHELPPPSSREIIDQPEEAHSEHRSSDEQ